jgi:hypothetical protein
MNHRARLRQTRLALTTGNFKEQKGTKCGLTVSRVSPGSSGMATNEPKGKDVLVLNKQANPPSSGQHPRKN